MLLDGAFDFAGKIIDRLWPDATQREAAKIKLAELQQSGELAALAAETDLAKGQQAINVEEAKNENLFVSGWRPFIGWVCGSAYAYAFVIQPLLGFILNASGHPIILPEVGIAELSPVLLGMLGLGGMRTFEKTRKS